MTLDMDIIFLYFQSCFALVKIKKKNPLSTARHYIVSIFYLSELISCGVYPEFVGKKKLEICDHKQDSYLQKIQMNNFNCFRDKKNTCL